MTAKFVQPMSSYKFCLNMLTKVTFGINPDSKNSTLKNSLSLLTEPSGC